MLVATSRDGEEVLHPTVVTLRESLPTLTAKKLLSSELVHFFAFVIMKESTLVTNSDNTGVH